MSMAAVLFVCMGNICRSPTAEGVFRRMVEEAGLKDAIRIDSAGTHDYHEGAPPDARAQLHAQRRGYDLSGLRARQVRASDFTDFDLILVMDRKNLETLRRVCPKEHAHKLRLLLEYAPLREEAEVPDPYYGGERGFDHVLDMVEDAARGLLGVMLRELRLPERPKNQG
ncbi:MAG: low molecular weight phosphotyrosine protein phosphatase [Proteobacteria bacterium]|nr:low molecular weight phosphotyrosine protein phosphatase [Pseudomonadota bacterium]